MFSYYQKPSLLKDMSTHVEGSAWFYAPDKVAPIVFAVLVLVSGTLHAWQTIKYKSWRSTLLLPLGAMYFVTGLAVRAAGAFDIQKQVLVTASTVLVLSGPPIYSCANYFILGRILYYVPYLSPMHPLRVITTFTSLDFVIEILVSYGARKLTSTSPTPTENKTGSEMVKAGTILQIVAFATCVSIAITFHVRASKVGVLKPNIRTTLYTLYTSCLLITARSVFRALEIFGGPAGFAYRHEYMFYIFEAGFMLVNSLLLNSFHPASFLPRDNRVFLAKDGVTEVMGPGWKDPRSWPVAIIDPFDIWGIVIGRDSKSEYWNGDAVFGGRDEVGSADVTLRDVESKV